MADPSIVPRLSGAGALLRERPEQMLADPVVRAQLEAAAIEVPPPGGPSRETLLAALPVRS